MAFAPWALAGGMLVSFTASAGYGPQPLPGQTAATSSQGEIWDAAGLHLLFQHDALGVAPSAFAQVSSQDIGALKASSFEPWGTGEAMTALQPKGATSPIQGDVQRPPQALGDGSTPATSRALALSSATPAPLDTTPVLISAAPVSPLPRAGLKHFGPLAKDRPDYVSLIDPKDMSREQRCLAEAIYFEARSESEEGQAAVAQVVLNRVKSGLYPTSVCGVVYQNRHRHLACQFTFACEGRSLRITERDSWQTAVRIAEEVTLGQTYLADIGNATHYHADYVRPYWSKRLKKMDMIGRHIFYKLRPGQT